MQISIYLRLFFFHANWLARVRIRGIASINRDKHRDFHASRELCEIFFHFNIKNLRRKNQDQKIFTEWWKEFRILLMSENWILKYVDVIKFLRSLEFECDLSQSNLMTNFQLVTNIKRVGIKELWKNLTFRIESKIINFT